MSLGISGKITRLRLSLLIGILLPVSLRLNVNILGHCC